MIRSLESLCFSLNGQNLHDVLRQDLLFGSKKPPGTDFLKHNRDFTITRKSAPGRSSLCRRNMHARKKLSELSLLSAGSVEEFDAMQKASAHSSKRDISHLYQQVGLFTPKANL